MGKERENDDFCRGRNLIPVRYKIPFSFYYEKKFFLPLSYHLHHHHDHRHRHQPLISFSSSQIELLVREKRKKKNYFTT